MENETMIIEQEFAKIPQNMGDYDELVQQGVTSFGVKERVNRYGCEFESIVENNTYAPMTWDGSETFTEDTTHWRRVTGSPEAWIAGRDKPAASEQHPYNGMGRIALKKNMVSGVNTLTQSMMQATNTIYVIRYDFTLGEDITVPENCVLEFDGGSISASDSNDTITGANTGISAGLVKIFNTDVTLAGTWNVNGLYPDYFGAVNSNSINSYPALYATVQACNSIGVPMLIGCSKFVSENTLILPAAGVKGVDKDVSILITKISNPTSDTVGFIYDLTGSGYNARSVISNVTFSANDIVNDDYTIIKIRSTSYGSRMENCQIGISRGIGILFEHQYYYELNNVVFAGKWYATSDISSEHVLRGYGFGFGYDDSEMNNVAFNKCNFQNLMSASKLSDDLSLFRGSCTITFNECCFEHFGGALGSFKTMQALFISCYIEGLCLNVEKPTSYSVALIGSNNTMFTNCLFNLTSCPSDVDLFYSVLGDIIMNGCNGGLPANFSGRYIKWLNYASEGNLKINNQSFLKGNSFFNGEGRQNISYSKGSYGDGPRIYGNIFVENIIANGTVERLIRKNTNIYSTGYDFNERDCGVLICGNEKFSLVIDVTLHIIFGNDNNGYIYLNQTFVAQCGGGMEYDPSSENYVDTSLNLYKVNEVFSDRVFYHGIEYPNLHWLNIFDMFKLKYIAKNETRNTYAIGFVAKQISLIDLSSSGINVGSVPKSYIQTFKIRNISTQIDVSGSMNIR